MRIRERGVKNTIYHEYTSDITLLLSRKNVFQLIKGRPTIRHKKIWSKKFGQKIVIFRAEMLFFDAQKLPEHPRNDPEQLWKN